MYAVPAGPAGGTGIAREDFVATGATSTGPGAAGKTSWGRRIAALPSGRRTKWFVLAFWLIVIVLLGSLAGKLMGAEKNDASA